jgi:hypothetical protein
VHIATALGFIFDCLMGMVIFRKLGWKLSRTVFYSAAWRVCLTLLVAWGAGIAYGFRHLVLWLHPGWILKTFGYCAAAYVSVPNYGLIAERTIPGHAELRHIVVSQLSMVVFIVLSVVFAFTIK